MTDPITDMLNRIRNAYAVLHPGVSIPFSKLKYEIAKILERQGFIEKAEKKGKKTTRTIEITLKYIDKTPAISALKRVSKQGQRIYNSRREIKRVSNGFVVTYQDIIYQDEQKIFNTLAEVCDFLKKYYED